MKKTLLLCLCLFSFSILFSQSTQSVVKTEQKVSAKTTCSGVNKAGNPCGMIVKKTGDKCRYHSDNKITCSGVTTKNKPCQMVVNKSGEKCWRHKS